MTQHPSPPRIEDPGAALPTRPRSALVFGIGLALAMGLAGCRSKGALPNRKADELRLKELRDLIQQNTLEPMSEVEVSDPYQGIEANMSIGPSIGEASQGEGEAAPPDAEGAEAEAGDEEPIDPFADLLPDPEEEFEENPYVEFGSRIIVQQDGRITKPYAMRPGMGERLVQFIRTYAPFKIWEPTEEIQPFDTVRVEVLKGFDIEVFQNMRAPVMAAGAEVPLADWIVVTAVPSLLRDVEYFIDVFTSRPPQIEIEAKIVEVVTRDQLSTGVRELDSATPIIDLPGTGLVDSITWGFPQTLESAPTLLTLGAVQDGTAYNAIFEALATYENVSISSHPKVAVRDGAQASIENTVDIPFFKVGSITPNGGFNANIEYRKTGISLFVIPRVLGTDTVALNIDIEASQQTGSVTTFAATDPNASDIVAPEISSRGARTTVYLREGQAVIIGGLVSERTVDSERKIPLLGDIPILGHLFKSTTKVQESSNVLFFIRPRILRGTDLNRPF